MNFEFDPATENEIKTQYKNGECSLSTYIEMLINKLVYLERKHAKLEVMESINKIEEQNLKSEIEQVREEISYQL